jgi:transcription elongation factor Elf1
MEYTYTLEKYNGLKTRYNCPECNHKHQFTRYVDQDGNHIAGHVGRCNRESKCGYHLKPREYFENSSVIRDSHKKTSNRQEPVKEVQYISPDILKATLQAYHRNTFVQYLHTIFDPETVQRLIEAYGLGTARDGSCIFWQVDNEGRVRTGKVIRYQDDGHRDKSQPPYFIHKKLNIEPIEQCLFGLHLHMVHDGPIGLVESEKTAVIMAGQLPEYTWMATGGKTNLSKVHALKGKKVVCFPDTDAFKDWSERLTPYGFKISKAMQNHVEDHDHGYDLADFVQSSLRYNDLTTTDKPYSETLKDGRTIEMHPAGYPLSWAV